MILGFDLDDVLFPTARSILINLRLLYPEKDIQMKYLTEKDAASIFDIPEDVVFDNVTKAVESDLEPYANSLCMLSGLAVDNDIHFITSRPESQFSITQSQLSSILDFDFVLDSTVDKHEYVKFWDIDVFVEDDPKYIIPISELTNCKVIVYDKPWNQKLNRKFPRVKNWIEIGNLLNKIYRNQ